MSIDLLLINPGGREKIYQQLGVETRQHIEEMSEARLERALYS
jgi:hypothetical protein|tara:strand:- start:318 stop:446 length:129 start_codon:yes stop_codon:yes gene_type:complete